MECQEKNKKKAPCRLHGGSKEGLPYAIGRLL